MCIDYRALNSWTVKDAMPIPRIDTLLDKLQGARVFSSLDLASGYWQVPIEESSRRYTAFVADNELWEWNVMPFGLCNAPATFQRMMNRILAPFARFCVVYLDDILIFSESAEQHQKHLSMVLEALKKAELVCCLPKCHMFRTELRFLGHVVGNGELKMDENKVKAVRDFPPPRTIKQLRSFLGLTGWYRDFVEDYAGIAHPLTELECKDAFAPLEEGSKEMAAFRALQLAITSQPVLRQAVMDQPFRVKCDASSYRLGGELSQQDQETGKWHPVAFFSRKLHGAEKNYDVRTQELLAIYSVLSHWKCYLEASIFEVVVLTDHKSLQWIRTKAELNRREARWVTFFSEYSGLDFQYEPGKDQVVPDALSRAVESSEDVRDTSPVVPDPDALEDPCEPVSATLTADAADYQDRRIYFVATSAERENRQLLPSLFARLSARYGPFSYDAFCEENGSNALCPNWWHREMSALQQDWSDPGGVWVHPPYKQELLQAAVQHGIDCWSRALDSSRIALMVPRWPQQQWYKLLQASAWRKVEYYPPGHRLFLDHRGVPLPETRFGVEVWMLRSQNSVSLSALTVVEATETARLLRAAQDDQEYQSVLRTKRDDPERFPNHEIGPDGLLYWKGRLQVPAGPLGLAIRENFVAECHDCEISGHLGIKKTIERLRRRATWHGLSEEVEDYVNSCSTCQTAKRRRAQPEGKLHPLPVPALPWQSVAIDILVNLPLTREGFDAILVVICRLTKMVHLIPCRTTDKVMDLAYRYVNGVYRLHGLQDSIVSDRDTKFESAFWEELHRLLGTRLDMTTTAHPQANGQAESQMPIVTQVLRTISARKVYDWDRHLGLVEYALNDAVHPATGKTPFVLCYGRHPRSPLDLLLPAKPPANVDLAGFLSEIRELWRTAATAIESAQQKMKTYYDEKHRDAPEFSPGDRVLLDTKAIPGLKRDPELADKLQPPFAGPFTVLDALPKDNYKIDLPSRLRIHNHFHVSKMKGFIPSYFREREDPGSPPALDLDTGDQYEEIECILKARYLRPPYGTSKARRGPQYLVKWKHRPESEASWRNETDLQETAPLVLEEFLQTLIRH